MPRGGEVTHGRLEKTIGALLLLMAGAIAATAMFLGGARPAAAADFCLEDNFTNTIVGKGFSVPAKGTCREFLGFFAGSVDASLFGQACGSSDNKHIRFHLTAMGTLLFGGYSFTLDRTSLSGEGQFCEADVLTAESGVCFELTSIAHTPCSPSIVPVP